MNYSDRKSPGQRTKDRPRAGWWSATSAGGAGKTFLAAVTVGGLLLSAAGVAHADVVYNNVDASVDAVAESMPLNAGGVTGTTTLAISAANGDGKQGCNLTAGSVLTLGLASSNAAVATVSPSSVTFSSCGETKVLTVTPLSAGTATVSATQSVNTTGGTFNLAPATFTVNVVAPAPANTAPSVTVAGVNTGASYSKGAVPAASCNIVDAEDGNSTVAAALSGVTGPYAADGIGQQTASCSYTDGGGLTASGSATYNILDPSGPQISYTLNPGTPNGLSEWFTVPLILTWTVTDSESPASLITTGCEEQAISADQVKIAYTCSATSAGGSTSKDTVPVGLDATAPEVSYAGAEGPVGNDGWFRGPVTATFTGTDATSGPAAQSASETTAAGAEGAAIEVRSPVFSDTAGNASALGAVTQSFKIDGTAPVVAYSEADREPNAKGWYNAPVTATFTGTDAVSGPAVATQTATSAGEGAAVVVGSPVFADVAGNASEAGTPSASYKIDLTAPSVSFTKLSGAEGANGWYTGPVTATFTGTDALSGPESAVKTTVSSGEGTDMVLASPAFTDDADNTTPAGEVSSAAFKVDLTDPVAKFDSVLADAYFRSLGTQPTCTATDAGSGPASCAVTGYSAEVGTHTLTATATDNAGRTSVTTQTYTVKAWEPKGFYQPIDMGSVLNTVKAGSTVPAKFEVFAGTTELTDTSIVKMGVRQITCSPLAIQDGIEITATGNTSLRYDSTGGQYIYNWKTPNMPGICFQLSMTSADGSHIDANFKLK
ncbi:PxKF domain-containing protein [Arthrobacter sp. ISL-5]|uniref:PxKF domain-containing protein n=1 Tax=Arthrobacter sp. ISL-5 TaxID=2819111 RepID=UPI001BEAB1A5|nr:PxKF domain-containing protein [Arthrobacter sp. ISL-5]MBT2553119.1 PxKF domain-containing protein [Arthrobacter sp. ISL-5]